MVGEVVMYVLSKLEKLGSEGMGDKRKDVKKGKGGNEKEKAICHAPSVAKKKKGREGYQPARMTA